VNARVLQQKGQSLYMFPMSSSDLERIAYVTPRSKNSPEEIQRIISEPRAKDIGKYIQEELSLFPNAIVVSLSEEVSVSPTGDAGEVVLEFPSPEGRHAYILDGQHRLAGFRYSGGVVFDLPVVALRGADEKLRAKIFADINSKQAQVSDVHLLSLYYQIKALPTEEGGTVDVVRSLTEDPDSPLRERIKFLDDEKNTWVKNTAMKKWLGPHVQSGGVLANKTPGDQAQILKEYFKGAEALWPDAWGNNKKYALTKPFGLEIMASIFRDVKHRVDLNQGRIYTADSFRRALEPLSAMAIQIPGAGAGASIPLSWESGNLGPLSNAAGRALIRKQMIDVLTAADETDGESLSADFGMD
jgi:DGQHR domain-containing protein